MNNLYMGSALMGKSPKKIEKPCLKDILTIITFCIGITGIIIIVGLVQSL